MAERSLCMQRCQMVGRMEVGRPGDPRRHLETAWSKLSAVKTWTTQRLKLFYLHDTIHRTFSSVRSLVASTLTIRTPDSIFPRIPRVKQAQDAVLGHRRHRGHCGMDRGYCSSQYSTARRLERMLS